ncbi:MAG: glutamate-1-semialdehyde 2,1-aminomutase [Nitrososphaerales archaeon]
MSFELYKRALKSFPGGVNSPARLLKPYPLYVKGAKGSRLKTLDEKELIDYCLAFGPLILGSANDYVTEEIKERLELGWIYGLCTEEEILLAEKIKKYFNMDLLRFVNSGAEASMNAIRAIRGYKGKRKIIMFEGNYHGSYDDLLVKAGSSMVGLPSSLGVLEDSTKNTLVLIYNDVEGLIKAVRENKEDLAGIIVEPIACNMGLVIPDFEFIKALREVCDSYDALLIFDEIVTGFRMREYSAQNFFKVYPDLTTLGKVIGGGFPIGVFGGKEEIMKKISPQGNVHNAGTFNAHPISIYAGLKTLEYIEKFNAIDKACNFAYNIGRNLVKMVQDFGLEARVNHIASMFQIFFTKGEIRNFSDVKRCDSEKYLRFHGEMMKKGVYLAPSQFETNFTSSAHNEIDLELTLKAMEEALRLK